MTEELKPCPFCGSDDLQNNGHYVECCNCHATGPSLYPVPYSKKAREIWNTRVEPNEIPGWLREKIKEQIDDYDMSIAIPRLLEAQRQYIKAQGIALDWVLSLKKEE